MASLVEQFSPQIKSSMPRYKYLKHLLWLWSDYPVILQHLVPGDAIIVSNWKYVKRNLVPV